MGALHNTPRQYYPVGNVIKIPGVLPAGGMRYYCYCTDINYFLNLIIQTETNVVKEIW